MTTATFLWEGDEEPAVLVRLEGDGTLSVAEARDALESDVPRFQDLIAVEMGVVKSGSRWDAHWLLISRAHEDRLHQYPQGWALLAAGLAPLVQGTVVVAPEDSKNPWLAVVKDRGRITAVSRVAPGELPKLGKGPFVVLSEPGSGLEVWKATGLPARILSRAAVVTPAIRARLTRQLDGAAGQEFAVLRLVPPRSNGLLVAASFALLAAVNVLLLAVEPSKPDAVAEPATVEAPRPSAVLARLAAAAPGLKLEEFRMIGPSWRLDLRTPHPVEALEALKKRAPGLRVLQFQVVSGGTRIVVEGEGYP